MKPTTFNYQHYTDLEADYMILKAENEQLKDARRWISVAEGLPERYISVLVVDKNEAPFQPIKVAFIGRTGEWAVDNRSDTLRLVTHWMPLPKLPERGGAMNHLGNICNTSGAKMEDKP